MKKKNPYADKSHGTPEHRLSMSLIYDHIDFTDLRQFEFETCPKFDHTTVDVYIKFDGKRIKVVDSETVRKLEWIGYPKNFISKAERILKKYKPKPALKRRPQLQRRPKLMRR